MTTESKRNRKDYNGGKIYCIRNTIDNDIYVGSTCQPLSKRMAKHRNRTNEVKYKHIRLYNKMNEHGVGSFYIELIEDCPCESVEQLRRREGHFIREVGTLNSKVSGRTKKEWELENDDHIKQQKREWRAANKEHIAQKDKEYKKQPWVKEKMKITYVCECGIKCLISNKPKHLRSKRHQKYEADKQITINDV